MKSLYYYAVLIAVIVFAADLLYAQDDYQKWLEKQDNEYNKFLEENDKQFKEFLEKNWVEVKAEPGIVPDKTPKPKLVPVCSAPAPVIKKTPVEPVVKPKDKDQALPKKETDRTITKPPEPSAPIKPAEPAKPTDPAPDVISPADISKERESGNMEIDYFGSVLKYNFQAAKAPHINGNPDNKKIAGFWVDISLCDHKDLLNYALQDKNKMKLNDWGYFLLLDKIAGRVYNKSHDEKELFVWFLLNKSGYKARTGISNGKIVLLIPSKNKIYEAPFVTSSGSEKDRYYEIDVDAFGKDAAGDLFTYDGDYAGAVKMMDMNFYSSPEIGSKMGYKILKFEYDGSEYKVPVCYNKGNVALYKDYPNADLSVYFNAPLYKETGEVLLRSLRPVIENKPEQEAANILLRFVQTAFEYKKDDEQFGREKPLFAEEFIFYRCSDCEDRAVFYSYLVRNLLHLDVIGVGYPGHVAAAVKFSSDVQGDYITYKNGKYTICDPTYIDANIGMCMPEFKGAPAKSIIEIR